jgi:hypothetical protein
VAIHPLNLEGRLGVHFANGALAQVRNPFVASWEVEAGSSSFT